jgi:putative aldouronate transport system substrate-binding protein
VLYPQYSIVFNITSNNIIIIHLFNQPDTNNLCKLVFIYNYVIISTIYLILINHWRGIIVMNRKYFGRSVSKNLIVLLLSISFFTLTISGQTSVSATKNLDISKQVELKWYVMGNGQQADTKIVETAVNKYLKDKINTTLKLTTFIWGSDFEDQMNIRMAAGEVFDITFTANWAFNYRRNAVNGAFVDITNMMDTYAPKTKALLGENILKGAEVGGRVYGLPVYSSGIVNDYGILLNKELVNKYKVDTSKIKKLEDLEPIFKKIKAQEPKIINFYPFDKNSFEGIYNILNYDNLVDNRTPGSVLRDGKSTKVLNFFDTPDANSLFSLMHKWYKSGYISKSSKADSNYFDSNKSNIFAFYSNLSPTKCEELLLYNDLDLVSISLSKKSLTTTNSTGCMQAISSTSKKPERALMFLELINTDEKLSNMINYGIEGIHYEKTGTNTISQIPLQYGKYNPGTSWLFGNQLIAYSLEGSPAAVSEKEVKEYVNTAVASPLLGFSFNAESVQSQTTKLSSIIEKYYNDLCLGKINPSVYLPKMNSELKKAGLQKVLSEMQKQVNAFKAAGNK